MHHLSSSYFLATAILLLGATFCRAQPNPSFYAEMAAMEFLVCDLLRHHPVYRSLSLETDCGYNIAKFGKNLCAVVLYFENLIFFHFHFKFTCSKMGERAESSAK
jgi:hypothetical protein